MSLLVAKKMGADVPHQEMLGSAMPNANAEGGCSRKSGNVGAAPKHADPLQRLLLSDAFDGEVSIKEPMARHTSYRIGGPADYFVRADSPSAVRDVVTACAAQDVPWTVVGRGTNLLVSDDGFAGVVLVLGRDFKRMSCDWGEHRITAGAAVMLSALVQEAMREELTGLEFAVGTPGTVGGAVRMNAGSRDEWMGSVISSIVTISAEHGIKRVAAADISWRYRSTSIPADAIIAECEVSMKESDPFFIRGRMEANLARRKKSQPLGQPSCGSVFKNPEGASAAKMIDELGLKGKRVGGAEVSEVHANFIVNTGGARAEDVRALMDLIRSEVQRAYGITLQPEVRLLGF